MASFFRTKIGNNIGTTPVDVLQTGSNNRFTVIGCNLANLADDNIFVDVIVVDDLSVEGYFIKQLVIAPYTSAKIVTNGEKLILAENCKLRLVSDTADSLDATISYVEIV